MKILHTSDWHLGKNLEGFSRIEEQEEIIEDIIEIVEKENIDLVIIAGDIYDTYNPPSSAEKLFYKTIKRMCGNKKRKIIVISGNHDSPDRITASNVLSRDYGTLVFSYPGELNGYEDLDSSYGIFDGYNLLMDIGSEKLNIGILPYPGESRLKRKFSDSLLDRDHQVGFREVMDEVFNRINDGFTSDRFNIFISHLFAMGGNLSDSERSIQLGGTQGISKEMFPNNADYCALGHFHKAQVISNSKNIYYSGSILPYSRSEATIKKSVIIIETENSSMKSIDLLPLRVIKPIEVWRFSNLEETIEYLFENQDRRVWAYVEIEMDRPLIQDEIKKIKSIKKDILSIVPIFNRSSDRKTIDFKEEKIDEVFKSFYRESYSEEPDSELLMKFVGLLEED